MTGSINQSYFCRKTVTDDVLWNLCYIQSFYISRIPLENCGAVSIVDAASRGRTTELLLFNIVLSCKELVTSVMLLRTIAYSSLGSITVQSGNIKLKVN